MRERIPRVVFHDEQVHLAVHIVGSVGEDFHQELLLVVLCRLRHFLGYDHSQPGQTSHVAPVHLRLVYVGQQPHHVLDFVDHTNYLVGPLSVIHYLRVTQRVDHVVFFGTHHHDEVTDREPHRGLV